MTHRMAAIKLPGEAPDSPLTGVDDMLRFNPEYAEITITH